MLAHIFRTRREKGDTLIEVLFAITIFSLVAVGTLSIMNEGSSTAQRALEITLVRQQINNQAEALRFLNSAYIAAYQQGEPSTYYASSTPAGQWAAMDTSIVATGTTVASNFGTTTSSCPTPPGGSFIIDTQNVKFISPFSGLFAPAQTYSQLVYSSSGALSDAQGIWIEAIRSPDNTDPAQTHTGYIDFHINACWDSPGQSAPLTLGTIVRLYEPR